MSIWSQAGDVPEVMGGRLEWIWHIGAPAQFCDDFLIQPLDRMYQGLQKTTDRRKRFEIYKKANEYIADQALQVFTVAPFGLCAVNEEVEFVPHVSQYLYLDYSSVTDRHWPVRGKSN
jgi:ABC-type transport system substrate-binding protein